MHQKDETLAKLSSNQHLSMNPLSEKLYKSLEKTNEYSELIIKGPYLVYRSIDLFLILSHVFSIAQRLKNLKPSKIIAEQGLSLVQAIKQVAFEVG